VLNSHQRIQRESVVGLRRAGAFPRLPIGRQTAAFQDPLHSTPLCAPLSVFSVSPVYLLCTMLTGMFITSAPSGSNTARRYLRAYSHNPVILLIVSASEMPSMYPAVQDPKHYKHCMYASCKPHVRIRASAGLLVPLRSATSLARGRISLRRKWATAHFSRLLARIHCLTVTPSRHARWAPGARIVCPLNGRDYCCPSSSMNG
jgi:hypothetical protein